MTAKLKSVGVGLMDSIVRPNNFADSIRNDFPTLATPTGLAVGFGPRVTLAAPSSLIHP